jgi:hypothetical protein
VKTKEQPNETANILHIGNFSIPATEFLNNQRTTGARFRDGTSVIMLAGLQMNVTSNITKNKEQILKGIAEEQLGPVSDHT